MDDTWVNDKPSRFLDYRMSVLRQITNLDYLGYLDYLVKIKAYTM